MWPAGQYQVTVAVHHVGKLMHDSLCQGLRTRNPAVARAMCNAVLDMAGLVLHIPPAKHRDSLKVSRH